MNALTNLLTKRINNDPSLLINHLGSTNNNHNNIAGSNTSICTNTITSIAISSSASSMIYRTMIRSVDRYVPKKLRPLWEHEAGPKTVFFWAPAIKWVSICLLNFE